MSRQMPIERQMLSASQLAELVGVEPSRLLDIEKISRTHYALVLEPETTDGPVQRDVPAVKQ